LHSLALSGVSCKNIGRAEKPPGSIELLLRGDEIRTTAIELGMRKRDGFNAEACATFVPTRVEDTIRAELPRLVGTVRSYEVIVSGARVSGTTADLENVRAVGTRIARAKAPVIDVWK